MKELLKGTVLFEEKKIDFNKVKENLKRNWQMDITSDITEEGFVFNVGNTLIKIVKNNEDLKDFMFEKVKNNIFWIEGESEVAKVKSYVDVIIEDGKDRVKLAKLFVKVVTSVLKVDGSIGVYREPSIISKEDYIDVAEELYDNEFPTLDMVYFGLYRTENGIGGYTKGLEFFGKKEIEVLDTDIDVEKLYTFLIDVADYVITSDVKLNDGETIGFSVEQKIPMSLSEGVAVEGESIKIDINKENI